MDETIKLIKCGHLFDGVKEQFLEHAEILVKGNRIEEVGQNLVVPHDVEVLDLSGLYVTPGMIDAHVHMEIMDWRIRGVFSDTIGALATARCAEKLLRRGFTTVRAVGAFGCCGYIFHDVRSQIEQGYLPGARMVISQGNGTTGSHGDSSKTSGMPSDMMLQFERKHVGIGNGPEFFRQSIREQKKLGYDFAKIMATGGFATPGDEPVDQQLSDDELKVIIDTAHEAGMPVTAHVYFSELVAKLANMGIDGVEHASLIDKATASLLEKKDVYVVPTFCPYEPVVNWNEENMRKKTIFAQRKYRIYRDQFVEGRKVLIDSNLRLGYGTDFVAQHFTYESGYEYEAWMNNGIDPYRALKAASSVNAEICKRPMIGKIAPGMLADISAWRRDPLTDPKALLDCAFVMKDGEVYETETVE